jgi:hypothetical protein
MSRKVGGIAGIFLEETQVLAAARKIREMGFLKFEAISPYPVHGMEEACGISRSSIPYVTFVAGLFGCSFGVWLTWWTSVVDWPINVGGKPLFSLPAFIPIVFELTVLFAALSSVAALVYHCRLPHHNPPDIDPDLTSHKFAIYVPEDDKGYDAAQLTKILNELGASEVKKVAEY